MKGDKFILALGDSHCGHVAGLTHPDWQINNTKGIANRSKFAKIQIELWNAFKHMIDNIPMKEIILFIMGDCIDGKGEKSGGTELITSDREEQCDMFVSIIDYIKSKKKIADIIMVYGTAFHTGVNEDWEGIIASKINATKIGNQEWPEVNGVVFDLRHFVGGTSVPYSRGTALSKESLWNWLWHEHGEQPKADIILRGHVHNYFYCGDNSFLAMSLPALQGLGSKFGGRKCSRCVDFGMVNFIVNSKGEYEWQSNIIKVEAQKAKILKL